MSSKSIYIPIPDRKPSISLKTNSANNLLIE